MAREKSKALTRADMIALLKSRGQKGRLSKMTKPQLKALVEKTAPPDDRSAHNETRPKGDLELEPDEQGGGHYFSREGKTRSKGAHEHKKNPWPATDTKAPAAPKPASPKKKKKKTDLEDPEATVTPDLAERRLNNNRHPATGAKLKARGGRAPGVIAERMRFLLRGKQYGTRAVNAADIKDHLFNLDAEYAAEFPDERGSRSGIDEANVVEGDRARREPDRLPQPATFVERQEGEGAGAGHSYRGWMKKNLKQYGGNMGAAAAAYRKQKGSGKEKGPMVTQDGGHYVRADGSTGSKEGAKYAGHRHRPAKNPVSDSDSEEDTRSTAPTRRITRGMDPRDARRARREQGGRGHGEQEGDGLWDDLKQGWDKDASAVESAGKAIENSSVGRAVARGYNSYEGYMDKHPLAQSLADDAIAGLGVAGLTLATGGFGTAAAVTELTEGAEVTAGAAETAATEGAEADAAESDAADARASRSNSDGPEPEPEPLANPASVGDTAAGADANAGAEGTMSNEVETANQKASKALKDAAESAKGKVKTAAADQASSFREKLKVVGKTAGLGVVGERAEEAAKDYQAGHEDDPGAGGPGGKGEGGKPANYFAERFEADQFSANSRALHHDGPTGFGNPWYS
eukprot:COSAG06_NODE_1589_length_9005_cov_38.454413_6_plen_632_part_00